MHLERREGRTRVTEFAEKLAAVVDTLTNDASATDRGDSIPQSHFDHLAALGLYGAFAPIELGGLGLSLAHLSDIVEELASACLATTFVWIQHFRLLAAALDLNAPAIVGDLRDEIVRGQITGGIALTGLQPGPARLTAAPARDGWTLDGEAPWVSGWGLVDRLVVAARGPDDTVVTVVLDAKDQPGLGVARRQLFCAQCQCHRATNVRRTVRRRQPRTRASAPRTGRASGGPSRQRIIGARGDAPVLQRNRTVGA